MTKSAGQASHATKSDTVEREVGDVKKEGTRARGKSLPSPRQEVCQPSFGPPSKAEEGCQPEVSFERHQVLQEEVMLFQTCNLEICGLTHALSPKMWEKADCEVCPWVEFSR